MTTESFELVHPADPRRVIRGRIERPQTEQLLPAVLIVHGFKGFMDWGFFPLVAAQIAAAGHVAVRFNLSGSGVGADFVDFSDEEAFARNTYLRELEDQELVRAFVTSGAVAGVDPTRLGLFGHSRGGGMGVSHAARCAAYAGLVVWAPIDDVDRFDDATKAVWREQGFISIPNARTGRPHRINLAALDEVEQHRAELDILAHCPRVEAPTLVLHGTADEAVEVAAGERIAAALPHGRFEAFAGAGHTFGATHPLLGSGGADLQRALALTLDHFRGTL